MKIICLDIEAADNGEMLELAVMEFEEEKTLYHSYFKPLRISNWPNTQEKHHITPDMVRNSPRFKSERAGVQRLIDESDAILGFAVDNDIKYLSDHGIRIPESKRIVEVKHWFWMYQGRELGFHIDKVPRLSRCAGILDFDFDEASDAHSAANDTAMTIRIMKRMMEKCGTPELNDETIRKFEVMYQVEFDKCLEERAHGFISLFQSEKGYSIRNNAEKPESAPQLMIEVRSRYKAEHDLRSKFKKRETAQDSGLYRLKETDIKYFLSYSNDYDKGAEEFYRCFYKPQKHNHPRPDFRLS